MDALALEIPRVHGKYGTERVDQALLTLAATGSPEAASDVLDIPASTIRQWRDKYPNRFHHLAAKYSADIEKVIATKTRETVTKASDTLSRLVDLENQRIDSGDIKDASASARNIATVIGITVDKLLVIEGRPTSIVENRSGDETLRAAEALGILTIEGTATELHDSPTAVVSAGESVEQRA